jgi:hypothetical protein
MRQAGARVQRFTAGVALRRQTSLLSSLQWF